MMGSNRAYHHTGCCMSSAVAGTSMRAIDILGTAALAVSIIIVRLIGLLLFQM